MGVYLPNMEMPKNCEACELAKHFDGYQENDCPFNAFSYYDCPLIPVPPHGRLIDADRLLSERMKRTYYHLPNGDTAIPIIDIEYAPTIITASEEET